MFDVWVCQFGWLDCLLLGGFIVWNFSGLRGVSGRFLFSCVLVVSLDCAGSVSCWRLVFA